MENKRLVFSFLRQNGMCVDSGEKYGIKISVTDNGELYVVGDANSLIDLADILVSLSLSKDSSDHVHLDSSIILAGDSKILEVIIEKK